MDSDLPSCSGFRFFPTCRFAALLLLALTLAPLGASALARRPEPRTLSRGFRGAIFTTDSTCAVVNANIYAAKTDVYLNGGGKGVSLPDGSYYVQVTEPNGTVLGSSGGGAPIEVRNGKFAACYQVWALTGGFDDSRNGEYKVWVCEDATFSQPSCKTDNFRVAASRDRTPTRTATSVPVSTATRTPTQTAARTVTAPPALTATRTSTPGSGLTGTATPTLTQTPATPGGGGQNTETATPSASSTSTPIVSTTTPSATVTPSTTPTATASPTPPVIASSTATATPVPGIPTLTPTFGTGGGSAIPAQVPTLSPAMLGLLALGLGALGIYLTRRG